MEVPLLIENPLRVLLLFHDRLANIQAVALGTADTSAAGTIRGREAASSLHQDDGPRQRDPDAAAPRLP